MVAEDDDEASKTEEPSERKISKAKEEGDVALSQDAKSFLMLLGMLFVVWLLLPILMKWFYQLSLPFIENPESIPTDARHIRLLLIHVVLGFFKILAIPFAVFMLLGVFASIAQTGFVFAPKKLEPDWNKLNIFAALPKFINMKKIVESLKDIVKITVIAFISILVIRPYLDKANLMPTMETTAILAFIHKVVVLLIFTVVIAVLVIAVADFAYQKYTHLKKLRMTKQEVKDEYTFERAWNLYEKKVGCKAKLEKKWNSMSQKDRKAAIEYIPLYVIATEDKKYRKNFQTFLNQRGWEDELIGATPPPAAINEHPSDISLLIDKTRAERNVNNADKDIIFKTRITGMIELLQKNPHSLCRKQLEIYRDNGTLERLGIQWNP